MKTQQILRNDNKFLAVLINPQAYRFRAFSGKPSNDAVLAFDVNYSWGLFAVGHVRSEGNTWMTVPEKENRPCLCIKANGLASIRKSSHPDFNLEKYSLVMQGGPSLIASNKCVVQPAIVQEQFGRKDVSRGDHVAIGTTKLNKVVAVYGHDVTMEELVIELLRYGSLNAMKCDGNSKSFFQYRTKSEVMKLGQAGSCRAGVQFEPVKR